MPVNNVSLTAPTDYALEQAKVARSQKLAEMLQQQAMSGSGGTEYAPGGYAVKKSPFEGLAKIAQAYLSTQMMKQSDDRLSELATQQRGDQSADMSALVKAMQGTPAQVRPQQGPTQDGSTLPDVEMPAVPGGLGNIDMNSLRTPETRQMVAKMMMEKAAKADEPYSLAPGAVRVQGGQTVASAPFKPPEGFTMGPGQVRFGPDGKQITAVPEKVDHNKPFNADGTPNPAYQAYETGLRVAGKPSMSSTVINAGPKAFEGEMGKSDAEQIGKWRAGAEVAQNTLQTVANLRDAAKSGVYSGGLAGAKTGAASLLNGITGVTLKELPGSERFNAEASKLVLDHVKSLGANPSNADRDFIVKTVPMLNTSPQARDAMINFLETKAKQQMNLFQRADEYGRANMGLRGFDPFAQPGAPKRRSSDKAAPGWSVVD